MRELKTLPVAGPTHEGSRSGWNVFRGSLFVAGTLIAGLAILAHFQIQPQRAALNTAQPKFEEIKFSLEDLTLESAWKAWNHFRAQDLDYRDTPEFLKNREKYAELSYLLYAAWTAAAVGLGLVLAALLWPSPRRLR